MTSNRSTPVSHICVYCGSSPGDDPRFMEAAIRLGALMAQAGLGLVYGGGKLGLMGAVAKSVKDNGGRVIGVIPDFLHSRERKFEEADELIIVPDMHTRKRIMFERADAFIALPGGIGTLEELVEQLTWVQLERHDKPVVIADIGGFWRPLISLLAHMRNAQFIRAGLEVRYLVAERIEDCIGMIEDAARRRAVAHEPRLDVDPRL